MPDKSERAKKGLDGEAAEPPYRPDYKGFDEELTRRAQATAGRAQEGAAARGEDANREYVDEGPGELARRTGRSPEELGESIERAARRRK